MKELQIFINNDSTCKRLQLTYLFVEQLGDSLSRSLEAARVLLEMLAVGAGALATTERVLSRASDECSDKLLRAAGCAPCGGHDARPCRNFCLNIARG